MIGVVVKGEKDYVSIDQGDFMNFLRYFPKIFLVTATLSLSACDLKKKDITPTKKQPASTVILLNGTSSAGKTTMLKELVKIDDSVQVVNFDGFFWGSYTKTHPTAELDELAKIARKDETANQKLNKLVEVYMRNAVDSFYADIRQKALKYKNVVVDTVIVAVVTIVAVVWMVEYPRTFPS